MECENCARLQHQIDEARDVLRGMGIEGFGSLSEGLVKLAFRINRGEAPVALELNEGNLRNLLGSVARTLLGIRRGNDEYLTDLIFKYEVVKLCFDLLANAKGLDPMGIVTDIHGSVLEWIESKKREVDATEKDSGEGSAPPPENAHPDPNPGR